MCCGDAAWKREKVPDHKFDFVNIPDYHSKSCAIRLQYVWLYILVIKSFLVYMSDIFTAVTMISSTKWSNDIFDSCKEPNGCVAVPFDIAKWLFVGCIIFSFLLLAYEAHKAKKIVKSRDISYAFTNVMANNYYSLRSYDHFCFFCHIENSTKRKDDFAFFVFFTFKGWKRLLLADGPRQSINALTLYSFILAKKSNGFEISGYFKGNDLVTNALLVTTTFTVVIFAGSLLLLIAAGIFYIPLLCYIQGNLKEYCCHKVDKRIAELMVRKNKQRLHKQNMLARKEAAGDFSHLKGKDGGLIAKPLPQPTLPNVSLDDEDIDPYADTKSLAPRGGPYAPSLNYASSIRTARTEGTYWNDSKDFPPPFPNNAAAPDYPPMPMYDGLDYPPPPIGGYAPQYGDNYGRRTPVQNGYNPAQGGWAANPPDRYGGVPGRQGTPVGTDRRGTPVGRPPTRDRDRAPAPPYVDPNAGNRMSGLAYDMGGDDAYHPHGGGHRPPPGDYSQWQGYGGGTAY